MARRIAAGRGDMSPMTVDSEEKEDTPREKEASRQFAYLADRLRAKRQRPTDAGAEQRRPPGRCGQGVEIGRDPSRTRRRVLTSAFVEELSLRASQEGTKTRRTRN